MIRLVRETWVLVLAAAICGAQTAPAAQTPGTDQSPAAAGQSSAGQGAAGSSTPGQAGAPGSAPAAGVQTAPTTPPQSTPSIAPSAAPVMQQAPALGQPAGASPAAPTPILGAPGAATPVPATSPLPTTSPGAATQPPAAGTVLPGAAGAPAGAASGSLPGATAAPGSAPGAAAGNAPTAAATVGGVGQPGAAGSATSVFALSDALQRANLSSTDYNTAVTESGVAIADRAIARAAVLPNVIYHNQYLYTEGTGHVVTTTPGSLAAPRFIANNAVHEYVSQGVVNESIGLASVANFRKANAGIALANAKLEVARRGLVVTVATNYYTLLATDKKLVVAGHAQNEADNFVKLTQQLEAAGEVARADVIKAQLQQQLRQRNRIDAQLANEKARLDLGVLLFPDPRTAYTLAESQNVPLPVLPTYEEVQTAAAKGNPDIRAAQAELRVAQLELSGARAAYLPDLALNYTYGIDAAQFAVHAPDGTRNLGYSAFATVDVPVFDWFATAARVKQSSLRRKQAELMLTAAQRRAIAELDEFYHEAQGAAADLQLLDQSVATAAESLRLTYLRYRAGEATALEVVDAQNSATDAESAQADGIVRYRVALANLQTLTGSLPK